MKSSWYSRPGLRTAALAAVALAVAAGAGCKHKRQSLRPVYVGAPIVTAPAATVDCAPGADCDSSVNSQAGPGFDDAIVPGGGTIESSPPARAPDSAPVPDAPTGRGAPEPPLELEPTGAESTTPLVAPQARRATPRTAAASASPKAQAALRTRLAGFADDPIDLFQPPKAERRWRYIVVHHSAHPEGGYAQIDRDHRESRQSDGCGYHFVVGNGTESEDGRIEVARRWSEQKAGAHCREGRTAEVNEYGIGICLVGDFEAEGPSEAQVEATRTLVAYLQQRYRIADSRVGTHSELAGTPTACPGKHFPTAAILGDRRQAAHVEDLPSDAAPAGRRAARTSLWATRPR